MSKFLGEIMEELKILQKNYEEILNSFKMISRDLKKKHLIEQKDFWRFFGKLLVLKNIAEIIKKCS